MIVDVDMANGPALLEPTVFSAFHAQAATTDADAVGAVMGAAGHAAGEGHVWVNVQWLRENAGDASGPQWDEDFGAMLAFAKSKDWLDEGEQHIRAHIEAIPA
jgi:hypothetical protein